MVCLGGKVLKQGKNYEKWYKPEKPASRLSEKEIRDYLSTHSVPEIIGSVWPRKKNRLKFISGRTSDIVYFGILGRGEDFMFRHARETGERVYQDSYFNKVLCQANKKGIIDFSNNNPGWIFQLMNLKLPIVLSQTIKEFDYFKIAA